MKKNNTVYFILYADDLRCPGSYILFSYTPIRPVDHGHLLKLNVNVTNFLNF